MEETKLKESRKKSSDKRDWPLLFCRNSSEATAAVGDKTLIHSHIIRATKKLLKNRSSSEVCLEILSSKELTSFFISVKIEDTDEVLQRILDHRIRLEEYEECTLIADLMKQCKQLREELKSSEDLSFENAFKDFGGFDGFEGLEGFEDF
jgi:hypothetical protein